MTDIKSMTLGEISEALRAMGEPSFRGKQVFSWLHRGVTEFDQMINIPKSLREKRANMSLPRRLLHASRSRSSTGRSSTFGSCLTATASKRC